MVERASRSKILPSCVSYWFELLFLEIGGRINESIDSL